MINQIPLKSQICMLYFALVEGYRTIQELYASLLKDLGAYITTITVCPCCNNDDMKWAMHSVYERSVTDLVPVMIDGEYCLDEDNNIIFETDPDKCTFPMEIKRIICLNCSKISKARKRTGHTHAVMGPLLIPYSKYSIRFAVYHLHNMYTSGKTVQEYSTETMLSAYTIKKWIKWLEDAIPQLIALHILPADFNTCSGDEQMKKVVEYIYVHFKEFYSAYLSLFNMVLFQRHVMPPYTRYFPDFEI